MPFSNDEDDWSDARDWDDARKYRLASIRSLSAWRLRHKNASQLVEKLQAMGPVASVKSVADILGWSKPTVRRFVRAHLIEAQRRRRASARASLILRTPSVIWLVNTCIRGSILPEPESDRPFDRIRRKIEREGTNGTYSQLPARPSVEELAIFFRCGETSILRMLKERAIRSKHKFLKRWDIWKRDLPFWGREEKRI
jgi:hypothetical protein